MKIFLGLLLVLLCDCTLLKSDQANRDVEASINLNAKTENESEPEPSNEICTQIVSGASSEPLSNREALKGSFLAEHNRVRKLYQLDPLEWDDDIAAYAQKWADQLKATNGCQMRHRSFDTMEGKDYGENLAINWSSMSVAKEAFVSSPKAVSLSWAKECQDYSLAEGKCEEGKNCEHFTQMIWKATKKLGCGVATCDEKENSNGSGRVEIWVCNYDPPGNMNSLKPF